jgi:DNA-binding MarR family transcriptional regulator
VVKKSQRVVDSDLTLEQKLLVLLVCIGQEQKLRIERMIRDNQLSFLQMNILNVLRSSKELLTVGQLNASLLEENPNVSRTLNKLSKLGYITKDRSADDQRTVFVGLTDEGRKAHDTAFRKSRKLGFDLSAQQRDDLYELLQKL